MWVYLSKNMPTCNYQRQSQEDTHPIRSLAVINKKYCYECCLCCLAIFPCKALHPSCLKTHVRLSQPPKHHVLVMTYEISSKIVKGEFLLHARLKFPECPRGLFVFQGRVVVYSQANCFTSALLQSQRLKQILTFLSAKSRSLQRANAWKRNS